VVMWKGLNGLEQGLTAGVEIMLEPLFDLA
jgi:hypothetical protein